MKRKAIVWLIVIAVIILAIYMGKRYSDKRKKDSLVNQIMSTGNQLDNFDADVAKLQAASITELQSVLQKVKEEVAAVKGEAAAAEETVQDWW